MIELDFLVVGAQKCGTTTLHDYLSRIDGVSLPVNKESHFFSHLDRYRRGRDWYEALFQPDAVLRGEVDPEYLFVPSAADRIRQVTNCKMFIFLFRDPCDRAISHYKMSKRRGLEGLSFHDALQSESDRRKTEDELLFSNHHSYASRGFYASQVKRYKALFPEARMFYMKFEDFVGDSAASQNCQRRLLEFLGLSSVELSDLRGLKSNVAKRPKSQLINKFLWDKRSLPVVRNLLKFLIPENIRKEIFRLIYSWNVKKYSSDSNNDFLFPPDVVESLQEEASELSKITGLDVSGWSVFEKASDNSGRVRENK
jgi:hypothetical protein